MEIKTLRETFLPYGHQWIDQADIDEVTKVLKSDYVTTGPKVKEFETKLAEYCGAKYAVAVSSGTAALHCACYAAGIKDGDEVITTPITFFATLASAMFCGGKPVLADVRKDTINLDPEKIWLRLSSKTKAIMPVDFAGHPVDIDRIRMIARKNNLIVIEDACHALGAEYYGRKVGSLSDMTVFSLHPVKSITTGEGGAILTDNKEYYDKMCAFRNHNIQKGDKYWKYQIENVGYNYRITDVQCALGVSQMKKLDAFVSRRHEIAQIYNLAFRNIDEIILPVELENMKSSHHLYVIQLKTLDREQVIEALSQRNIGAQIHYIPCHLQPAMRKLGYREGDFYNAENYYKRCLSLPLFPAMSDKDIQDVITTVKEVISDFTK